MSIEQLAIGIYQEFRAKPESQRIAGEFALIELSRLLTRIKPKHVLEIGAGIGTITKLLLTHPDRPDRITTTEGNHVCLTELTKNLSGLSLDDFRLVNSPDELDMTEQYDLIIFDGTLDKKKQYQVFQEGTWCFVEGSRSSTISTLAKKLASRGLSINIENKRPGGMKIRFLSTRRIFGFRHPVMKFKQLKGCSIGQVRRDQALEMGNIASGG